MKKKSEKETHYAREKGVQSTLYTFGLGIGLAKRVTYRYPIGVLEKLIEETKKRQPEDPTNYFLNGLKRSRVKYGCNEKVNRKRKGMIPFLILVNTLSFTSNILSMS